MAWVSNWELLPNSIHSVMTSSQQVHQKLEKSNQTLPTVSFVFLFPRVNVQNGFNLMILYHWFNNKLNSDRMSA